MLMGTRITQITRIFADSFDLTEDFGIICLLHYVRGTFKVLRT